MKYKTKPVEIEAIRWTGLNLEEIKTFVGDSLIYNIIDTAWQVGKGRPHVLMKIKTLEGDMHVSEGDYIIKGLKGEFYPCKPDIFEKKYERMDRENVVELIATCIIKEGMDSGISGTVSKELADKMTSLFKEMYEWQNKNTK